MGVDKHMVKLYRTKYTHTYTQINMEQLGKSESVEWIISMPI